MTLVVVESEPDPASVAIAGALRRIETFEDDGTTVQGAPALRWKGPLDVRLVRIPFLHLHAEPLDHDLSRVAIDPSAVIFLSKHKADSGRSALTVHPVGNPTAALYGGQPGRFSPSSPAWQSRLLLALRDSADVAGYDAEVTFEVTHHGPLLPFPTMFLELGSGPEQWGDPRGAAVVAQALATSLRDPPVSRPTLVGVGGGHYAPRSVEAVRTYPVHVGHMLAAHALESAPNIEGLVQECVTGTPVAEGYLLHRGKLAPELLGRVQSAFEAAGLAPYELKDLGRLAKTTLPNRANL